MKTREQRIEGADRAYERLRAKEKIDYADLADALGAEIGPEMNIRYGDIIRRHGLWEDALDLAFDANPKVGFRGSWALEWAYSHDRKALEPYAGRFIEDFLRSENPSVLRTYSKMLHDMMRRGIARPDAAQKELIAERCFDLLINPETKVAIKVWCNEILFSLRGDVPWINEHLEDVVSVQLDAPDCTPAYSNHGMKLLKKLRKK